MRRRGLLQARGKFKSWCLRRGVRRRGLLQARGKVKSWCLRKGGLEGGYERLGTYLSFGASDGVFLEGDKLAAGGSFIEEIR